MFKELKEVIKEVKEGIRAMLYQVENILLIEIRYKLFKKKQMEMLELKSTIIEMKNSLEGTSLVVQWLRICLPMQGTRVRALVQEDPTCRGATKPVCHDY